MLGSGRWPVLLGLILLAASVAVYSIHYAIFRDVHHIFIYLVGDIAFVFVEVFLVTLIIHRLLSEREKRARLEKLNMVIGAFFSEVGTGLLRYLSGFDPELDNIKKELIVTDDWTDQEFARVNARLREYDYQVDVQESELEQLTSFLVSKRDFLMRLLENPTLLEHESFAELLRAICHATEELAARDNLRGLSGADRAHLSNDLRRGYVLLVQQWLDYMHHLKASYPYFFSFAMRTNPFDHNASPSIK